MKLQHFLSTCDLARPAADIALDLVCMAGEFSLTAEQVTLGVPELPEDRVDLADDTTVWLPLTLDPSVAADFPGLTGVRYRRIPLSWVTQNRVLRFRHAYPFSTLDVLSELNAQLGTQFTTDDVVDRTYTSEEDIFFLEVKPESLVWCNTPYPHLGPYYASSSDQTPPPTLVTPPAPDDGEEVWIPGQTDFSFDLSPYTPNTNFTF